MWPVWKLRVILLFTVWQDTKTVTMLSTNSQPTAQHSVARRKKDGSRVGVPCPDAIEQRQKKGKSHSLPLVVNTLGHLYPEALFSLLLSSVSCAADKMSRDEMKRSHTVPTVTSLPSARRRWCYILKTMGCSLESCLWRGSFRCFGLKTHNHSDPHPPCTCYIVE